MLPVATSGVQRPLDLNGDSAMNHRLLSSLLIGALVAVPAAASAQLSTGLSVAAGVALPTGDGSDQISTGYNAALGLNIGAPLVPVGLRLEGGYNGFKLKDTPGVTGDSRIISGTANATFGLGLPYLIGGLGWYQAHSSVTSGTVTASTTKSAVGFNVGAGVRFPLGVMSTFVEARYHKAGGDVDASYVPITFGIQF
jgi:Outer membrane protein beta-barrel domain